MRRRPPRVFRRKGSPFWQADFQLEGTRFQESLDWLGAKCDKATAQAVLERNWREALDRTERAKRSGREPMTFGAAAW